MKKNNTNPRRDFLELSLKSSLALPFLLNPIFGCNSSEISSTKNSSHKSLKILILGGTSFLGPNQIAEAFQRGHSISTFTRGKTKPSLHQNLFEQVEQLIGDRENDLSALENRKWDVVIDNSGRKVEWTKKTAELLKDNCQLYVFISSTGVYYPYKSEDFKEDYPVVRSLPEDANEDSKMEYDYGIMKANSELQAIEHFGPERTIIIRPTYMIGPADKTNRFIHWPLRLKKGGDILVPGKENDLVQYIDVRDVSKFIFHLIENDITGTFNAVGPEQKQNIHQFIDQAITTFDAPSNIVKIDDYDFLESNKVFYIVPWIMPRDNNRGSAMINNQKSIKNGLSFTSIQKSIKDTYDWWISNELSVEHRLAYESDSKTILLREKEILNNWEKHKM